MTVTEQDYLTGLARTVAAEVVQALKTEGLVRPAPDDLLNEGQVAARLNISARSVRQMIKDGALASLKVGPGADSVAGSRMVLASEVDRYVEERRLAGRDGRS